jgi:hypothetical protein
MKILWPKRNAEYIEPSLQYIEHQKLVAVHPYKGSQKEKQQQRITYPFAVFIELATRFFGEYPGPLPFLVDRAYGIPKGIVHDNVVIEGP